MLSREQEAVLGAAVQPGGQLDAATKRAHKIRRFQLEKAVTAELDAMKMKVGGCVCACGRLSVQLPTLCRRRLPLAPEPSRSACLSG